MALLAGAGLEWAAPERVEPTGRRPQVWVRVAGERPCWVPWRVWAGGTRGGLLLVALIALTFVALVAKDVYARVARPKLSASEATGE